MNRGATEILQCLNVPQNVINTDACGIQMKELETNRVDSVKWQHEQQSLSVSYITGDDVFQGLMNIDHGLGYLFSDQELKQEPVFETSWNAFDGNSSSGGDISSIQRTISCPPAVVSAMAEGFAATSKGKEITSPPEKMSLTVGRESFKKRKLEKTRSQKEIPEEEVKDKKMKGCAQEDDSKITEQHSNNSKQSEPSVDASKVSEVKKPDFIHVRARRGQATDSHSLAERVRREKISERMKFLQDLVPGCNKIVGKAGMLDEIINYVQSLQRQVEFLSMKLATVNHTIDFNIDSFFSKEMEMGNPANLPFNPLAQVVPCPGIENRISPPDMALRRTISAPVSLPETLLHQSCFNQIQHSSNWEANFQNLYGMELEQGKSTSMFCLPLSGYIEAGHVKLEI